MLNKINLKIIHNQTFIFLLIFFIYLFAIFITYPEKKENIGKRHQDLIAHQLITYQIWEKKGFLFYSGGLILTYPNPGDLNVKADPIQTGKNSNGEFFYFSYPPFTFYSTYFLLKLFHLPINEFSIRWVASCFLLLNVLALYFIFKEYSFLPIIGYLFLPNVLWFHHNVWFVDIQCITFILWAIYFSFHSFKLFLICIFLACFTEWWGFLFTICLLFYVKLNLSKSLNTFIPMGNVLFNNPKNITWTLLVALISLLLFVLININIVGINEFFWGLYDRLVLRIGFNTKDLDYFSRFQLKTYWFITWYYLRNYLPTLIILLIFFLIFVKKNNNLWKLYILSPVVLSIFLHHFILLNWTAAHDFSVLKFSIIIPFLIFGFQSSLKDSYKKIFTLAIITLIPIHLYLYYKHKNVERNLHYEELAECIKRNFKKSVTAKANFANQPLPYLWWKSERNVVNDWNSVCQ